MPHFFVDSLDGPVALSERDSRHALRSLRLEPGEGVTLADGRGRLASGRLTGEDHGRAVVDVESVRRVVRSGPLISVALAPPKGERLGWGVQKLAEIGVDETVLIQSERSIRAWEPQRAERALDRLRAVVREAAMQSRQPFLMEVRTGLELEEVLSRPGLTAILLWEGEAPPLARVLPDETGGLRLIVGPEGGFTEREVEGAVDRGVALGSLGSNILRTETAAVVGASLALSRYGRLG